MPNKNSGNNAAGWSVNAGNNSGGLQRGIFGGVLNTLNRIGRAQEDRSEFDYKEEAKRDTYLQRKAADHAGHVMKIEANKKVVSDMARRHGKTKDANGNSMDRPNFNFNAVTGAMSYSLPSTYTEDMLKLGAINQETERLKNERAKEKSVPTAQRTEAANGNKKDRSTKKTETALNANDEWAAQPPKQTSFRTTSNITPPTVTAPKLRKPRASRAPKNPGQPGGMK